MSFTHSYSIGLDSQFNSSTQMNDRQIGIVSKRDIRSTENENHHA